MMLLMLSYDLPCGITEDPQDTEVYCESIPALPYRRGAEQLRGKDGDIQRIRQQRQERGSGLR